MVHYSVLVSYGLTQWQGLADSVISNILLAACCLLIINNMRYYLPRQEKYWYVLVISGGLASVWLIAIRMLLWAIFQNEHAYLEMVSSSSTVRFGVAFLMLGCMATMSLLFFTQKEQKEMEARKMEAEKLAKEAELYKLRQQLQPHFLFNSLNSISALIGSQPEHARKMIHQLSDFLRGTLKKEERQLVNLEEEMQYLELYLDIEKVRFGHRLSTVMECEQACRAMKLPSLLLQPIVENAIKFGLYDTTGDITIRITAAANKNYLEVSVENPFDPETSSPKKGTGFGLSSVQRRLYLLFARNDLLETKVNDNLFMTIVKIPQPQ
ncbi:MAG: histidine kinase [Bacteroidetes bacterium]|nr:histidine kinase [Bacteroidota bacterium]MBS1974326.1 histidine kinase [Bacteroidota bacterium]